jgi:Bacterial SCP ortholog
MPVRKGDPARLLAAVNAQRAALGRPEWAGPVTAAALEAACVSAVLDAIDLDQGPERDAARLAVTYLLGLLEAKAPGRAVEVRIPPFAAIQCVEGPRHTRGTPPNVVETDAVTWVLLATGRLAWPDAVADGRVRASGPRADISAYLPLSAMGSAPHAPGEQPV